MWTRLYWYTEGIGRDYNSELSELRIVDSEVDSECDDIGEYESSR